MTLWRSIFRTVDRNVAVADHTLRLDVGMSGSQLLDQRHDRIHLSLGIVANRRVMENFNSDRAVVHALLAAPEGITGVPGGAAFRRELANGSIRGNDIVRGCTTCQKSLHHAAHVRRSGVMNNDRVDRARANTRIVGAHPERLQGDADLAARYSDLWVVASDRFPALHTQLRVQRPKYAINASIRRKARAWNFG